MKPFIVFGGSGAPTGGTADVRGLHGSIDEAVAQIAALGLAWWEIAVMREEGMEVVRRAEAVEETSGSRRRKVASTLESGE